MKWLQCFFLITAMLATSGYRFRCYFFCVDQTSTQNDYVEQRDYCREYAQLKANMAMRDGAPEADDKSRKATLVSLFSTCMGKNGWTVPDGKGEGGGIKKADATITPVIPTPTLASTKSEDKALLTRTAECAFARNSASISSNAKLRAEACDLECSEALRLSPNAPRPASCPSEMPAKLAHGNEE